MYHRCFMFWTWYNSAFPYSAKLRPSFLLSGRAKRFFVWPAARLGKICGVPAEPVAHLDKNMRCFDRVGCPPRQKGVVFRQSRLPAWTKTCGVSTEPNAAGAKGAVCRHLWPRNALFIVMRSLRFFNRRLTRQVVSACGKQR